MEAAINRIEERLHRKLAVYRDLVDILEKETEILRSADPGELWKMSGLKHEAAIKIEKLRREVIGDLSSIAPNHGMAPERFSSKK